MFSVTLLGSVDNRMGNINLCVTGAGNIKHRHKLRGVKNYHYKEFRFITHTKYLVSF